VSTAADLLLVAGMAALVVGGLMLPAPRCRRCGRRATLADEELVAESPPIVDVTYYCTGCGEAVARRRIGVPD
jgi:hypothetical protein